MHICIVGAGYVGLVTGACLAKVGHNVRCVDVRPEAVDAINAGCSPIVEPGLDEIIRSGRREERFRATLSLGEGMEGAEIILIAVGTPTKQGNIDLSYVRDAAAAIGEIFAGTKGYRAVAVKSTVVPGTTDGLVRTTLEAVMEVNRSRASTLADMVEQPLKGLQGRTVAVLGLTFKPLTDDLRDSPALAAAAALLERGAVVRGYDPQVPPDRQDPGIPAGLVLCGGLAEALEAADAALLATAWQEIVEADWATLCTGMRIPLIVDGRNALKRVAWPEGVLYRPIGRHYGKGTEVS